MFEYYFKLFRETYPNGFERRSVRNSIDWRAWTEDGEIICEHQVDGEWLENFRLSKGNASDSPLLEFTRSVVMDRHGPEAIEIADGVFEILPAKISDV